MISSSAIDRLVDLKVQNAQFRNGIDAENQRFDMEQKRAMAPIQRTEAAMRLSSMQDENNFARRKRRNEALTTGMI